MLQKLITLNKFFSVLLFLGVVCLGLNTPVYGRWGNSFFSEGDSSTLGVRKIKDIIIYQDSMFHAAFPSVVRLADGEFFLAFRRAPDRKIFEEEKTYHVDPNSYLVGLRSSNGEEWGQKPELIHAFAFGGSQDPCLLQLRNGNLLCMSYAWTFVRPDGVPNLKKPFSENLPGSIAFGGYSLRSADMGHSWEGPFFPPTIEPESRYNALGMPMPAHNRGALYEGKDGRIFWVVAALTENSKRTSNYLLISEDQGFTWKYSCPVAVDDEVAFNETSIYETPKGDLVAFLRTANFDGQACIARSTDGGKSFQPWKSMGFKGHPLQAMRLPDKRVLLVYGYRHEPLGIRARILNPECTDYATAPEIILREDGGTTDIGYPWSVQLDEKRVLVTYYYNIEDGTRHIAGTILEIE
ncbi:sialidase-1 [Catalinimonas alkaloidigena]|uniref:sialidase family protein n=1 Tax=Catalinimonas alkaloidigena TaxID=1075417 RepID=UPI002405387F|nr:sialidase family protein [Catalinimonas alkaloidigena]MDF9798937.1 sialidase-1 [Catalinimonas alkaloidigena]